MLELFKLNTMMRIIDHCGFTNQEIACIHSRIRNIFDIRTL